MSAIENEITATPSSHPQIESARDCFPILSGEVNGAALIYLDNAASYQKTVQVIQAMTDMQRNVYANVHRGLHFLSNTAMERYEGFAKHVAHS